MRPLVALPLAAAALAAVVATGGAQAGDAVTAHRTSLTVTVRAEPGGPPAVRTLRCGPAGGTHPTPARACARLEAMTRPFAPIPADAACTQVYGGPARAVVTGTFRGRRLWVSFARRNGCEIARWERHAFLFPRLPGG